MSKEHDEKNCALHSAKADLHNQRRRQAYSPSELEVGFQPRRATVSLIKYIVLDSRAC